ncbi:MAG: hypothetical protein ABJC05_06350 [Pyrinomonadaceae bacterium]
MKRWKKVRIVLLAVVVLSQLPFAWRRYRLTRLHTAIQQLANQRLAAQSDSGFRDYKGVIHVHSFLGGHSTGTLQAIIDAAKNNGLDFVIMTEHPAKDFDTAATTLNGLHGGVLFINGNEVVTATGDRLLLIPGDESAARANTASTQEVIAQQKARGGLAIVAYPTEFRNWEAIDYNGVEVYNLFTNARRLKPVVGVFDGLWSYRSYPDLMFANFYERPSPNLQSWDSAIMSSKRRLVALAGNDAHANIGLSLYDSSGRQILGMKLDPYERSFRVVRTHVLIESSQALTSEALTAAIAAGRCYLGFDLFGDSTGFNFTAHNKSETKIMGDEISLLDGVELNVTTPVAARIVLLRDGIKVQEESSAWQKQFSVKEPGAFRVEVYLPQLPKPVSDQPWIISNPIYIK